MRALVVTSAPLATTPDQRAGLFMRLGIFLDALGQLADRIAIAHFLPAAARELAEPSDRLDAQLSAFWGRELRAVLLPQQTRTETFANHYLRGIAHAAAQPTVFPYAGAEQAAAVGALLDAGPDIVLVHRLPAMCAVLGSGRRPAKMFFDLDDLDHRVRARHALQRPIWPGKLAYLAHVPALLAAEREGARRAARTFVCSAGDQAHLRRFRFGDRVEVVPNAAAVPAQPPGLVAEPTLAFVGTCEYPPNVAAAERLVRRILPLVRREVPGARLLLAGKRSDELPSRRDAPEGVEYLGFVPDLDALYARTRVVCCPIAIGGGTRIKLIEAAGQARPMVSTAIGAEGLDFVPEAEILLRDDDAAFAAACAGLLRDDAACLRLGAAARARMVALYDAGRITARLAGLMRSAAS